MDFTMETSKPLSSQAGGTNVEKSSSKIDDKISDIMPLDLTMYGDKPTDFPKLLWQPRPLDLSVAVRLTLNPATGFLESQDGKVRAEHEEKGCNEKHSQMTASAEMEAEHFSMESVSDSIQKQAEEQGGCQEFRTVDSTTETGFCHHEDQGVQTDDMLINNCVKGNDVANTLAHLCNKLTSLILMFCKSTSSEHIIDMNEAKRLKKRPADVEECALSIACFIFNIVKKKQIVVFQDEQKQQMQSTVGTQVISNKSLDATSCDINSPKCIPLEDKPVADFVGLCSSKETTPPCAISAPSSSKNPSEESTSHDSQEIESPLSVNSSGTRRKKKKVPTATLR